MINKNYEEIINDFIDKMESENMERFNKMFEKYEDEDIEKIQPIINYYFKKGFSIGIEFLNYLKI